MWVNLPRAILQVEKRYKPKWTKHVLPILRRMLRNPSLVLVLVLPLLLLCPPLIITSLAITHILPDVRFLSQTESTPCICLTGPNAPCSRCSTSLLGLDFTWWWWLSLPWSTPMLGPTRLPKSPPRLRWCRRTVQGWPSCTGTTITKRHYHVNTPWWLYLVSLPVHWSSGRPTCRVCNHNPSLPRAFVNACLDHRWSTSSYATHSVG